MDHGFLVNFPRFPFCFYLSSDDAKVNVNLTQESIRNSADGILLSAPDALVVSITKHHGSSVDEQLNTSILISTPRKSQGQNFGIDGLDSLKFTYKVYFMV